MRRPQKSLIICAMDLLRTDAAHPATNSGCGCTGIEAIEKDEALALLRPERRMELRERAHAVTERCVEKRFDFCSIINARSGRCTENCKWCAQSAHWKTSC